MPTPKSEVIQFLKDFKKDMSSDGLAFVDRKVNLDCLAILGLSVQDAERIIHSLTERDYIKGPEQDHDGSAGEVWAFTKFYAGEQIYTKLKLGPYGPKCLSFHPKRSS